MAMVPTTDSGDRLEFRCDPEIKVLIQQAARMRGQSLTDFAVSTLIEHAEEVIKSHSTVCLSNRDRDKFLALLDAKRSPGRAALDAAKRYRDTVIEE